jgi:stage II sporulation protein D
MSSNNKHNREEIPMKKYLFLVTLFIMFILCNCIYAAVEIPDEVRVGLFRARTDKSEVVLKSENGLEIYTRNEDDYTLINEIKPNQEIIVQKSSSSNEAVYIEGIGKIGNNDNIVVVCPKENSDGIKLISVDGIVYRGKIEIRRFSNSDLTIINVLPIQEYLYAVVPREIGSTAPEEALKAQAIIARTYVANKQNRWEKWGFDVYPNETDQVYGKYSDEQPTSNKAVDETKDMVATFDGKLISGNYFSTSGGYTEDCENVWSSKVPYLRAVPDTYEPTNLKWTQWTVTLSADQIKQRLLDIYDIDLGNIIDIKPTKFSKVGRVTELKIIGTDGEKVITNESTRTYFGLYSQWFTVNDDAPKAIVIEKEEPEEINDTPIQTEEKPLLKKIKDILINDETLISKISEKRTTLSSLEIPKGTFVFQGRGYGHAVGMSQNGAMGMARNNFSCEEIIKWYYTGAEIQK